MKPVLAIAAVCLLGAIAFALVPADEAVATAADAPAAAPALEAVAEEPTPALSFAALEPGALPEELVTLDSIELDTDDAWLTGRVTPQSGSQPQVHLIFQGACSEDTCSPMMVEADADPVTGVFSVQLAPGTWQIVARAEAFLPATEDGFTVSAGEELAELVMTLERGERISGSVVFEGQPVEGAQVAAISDAWARTTVTDGFGRFELAGLPGGSYTVRAYSGSYGGDEKTVAAGSAVHLDLAHREKIVGQVVNERGFPVEGAAIYTDYTPIDVFDSDPFPGAAAPIITLGAHGCGPSPSCYHRMVTGPDGRFEVATSPGQTLTVSAEHVTRFASLQSAMPGEPLTLVLEEGLRVRVVDSDQNPISGVEVDVEPQPRFFRIPQSDAQGFITLPGRTFLTVSAPPEYTVLGDVPVQPWRIKEPMSEIIY